MASALRGSKGVSKRNVLEPTAHLWYGPMSSGKSDRLNIQMEVLKKARYNCLLIKYKKDVRTTKDESVCVSKSGIVCDNTVSVAKNGLMDMIHNPDNENYARLLEADCVGIDEVQFFNQSVEFVTLLLLAKKKTVFMAGLHTDFPNETWPYLARMISICSTSEGCQGVCTECGSLKASTTARITDDLSLEKIGGKDQYATMCLSCFVEKSKHKGKHLDIVM